MGYENYYLDLKKVQLLKSDEQLKIHNYYCDMLNFQELGKIALAKSYFLTLFHGGYLIDSRNEKIENILNGNNSINN